MRATLDAVLLVAAVVTAVATILGALWWLVRPRLDRYLQRLTDGCLLQIGDAVNVLADHARRLEALERTRSTVALDELVDLVQLMQAHRPQPRNWPPPALDDDERPEDS